MSASVSAYQDVTAEAVVPQPVAAGDVVGLVLQAGAMALPAQVVSFGEVFAAGQLAAGASLVAVVDGVRETAQVDAKTFNADGSVASAVVSLAAPALAAGGAASVMLAQATAADPAPAALIDLAAASQAHSLSVQVAVAGGGTMTMDVLAALRAALAAGTASFWEQGPLATQARVDIALSGSLHLVADVTATADGTLTATLGFDNDLAMGASGGTVTLDASATLDGTTTTLATGLTQYQYEDWHATLSSTGAAAPTVQHDVAALERTGAIADYDTTVGVAADWMQGEAQAVAATGWDAPLAIDGITQGMPSTGGRADIGPTTQGDAAWLLTQDPTAQAYALGQADAAAGIPWHFSYDGGWLDTDYAANIWTDPRSGQYNTALTQQVSTTNNGWVTDQSHQPDISYVAYLLTGQRVYLDDLNAQAAYDVTEEWPGEYFTDASGVEVGSSRLVAGLDDNVINNSPVRGAAWNLRQIDEASWVNPAGSTEGAYFTQVAADNWGWLVAQLPAWQTEEGASYGWLPQGNNIGNFPPWQQDYFASTAIAAAEHGNADALTYLEWAQNFLVGRFLHAADGFDPNNGVTYQLGYENDGSNVLPTSWAQLQADTAALGDDNGAGWACSQGDFAMLGLETLAGYITVLGSTDAMRAYGWLLASGAPYIDLAALQDNSQFAVAPRLSDGALLTRAEVTIADDATATTLTTSGVHALVYETGAGNVTIQGGAGINVLFAGAGQDVLLGGGGTDSLFGGAGSVTLAGGAGTNVMETGGGAATFVLAAADVAQDTIIGFRPGTDALQISNADGTPLDVSQAAALAAAATTDAAGDAVVALSSSHDVTLTGIGLAQLGAVLAAGAVADPVDVATSVDAGSTSTTGTTGGSLGTGAAGSTSATVTAGGPVGSSGGDTASATGTAGGSAGATGATSATGSASGSSSPQGGSGGTAATTSSAGSPTVLGASSSGTYAVVADTTTATTAQGASVVTDTTSGYNLIASLGEDTITAGSGWDTVFASGASASVTGGTGHLVFVAGSGSYSVNGGQGSATLYGGTGSATLQGGAAGGNVLVAGPGNATLLGGHGDLMFGGLADTTFTGSQAGGDLMVGGAGHNTFNMTQGGVAFGGGTLDTFVAGSGSAIIVEGPGHGAVTFGSGAATAFAGTGQDTFTVTSGLAGTDGVVGFKADDQLVLQGYSSAEVSHALSSASTGAFGTSLSLGDGTTVTLWGVHALGTGQLVGA